MSKLYLFLISMLFIIGFGCKRTSTIEDFTYTYSMENVNNFKIEFQLVSDSTYEISQFNYFFDNFEGNKKPIVTKGKLDNEEFSRFEKLIEKSDINSMKDSYGFENETDNDVVYMIGLEQEDKTKFVSINLNAIDSFSQEFKDLISYTNTIISAKHQVQ